MTFILKNNVIEILRFKNKNMFHYISNKKSTLEIQIDQNFTENDLERVFFFIEALIDTPKMSVKFKVNESIKENFKQLIEKNNWYSFYGCNIQ